MTVRIASTDAAEQLLELYDYFLFDCDGVLWLGTHLLPRVVETLAMLKARGKKCVFVTNNSTKLREQYLAKFELLGIHSVEKSDIFGSAYALAVYLKKVLQLPAGAKVFVVGEKGIEVELEEVGYRVVGGTAPELKQVAVEYTTAPYITNVDPEVKAVVVGLDQSITYYKAATAQQYLRDEAIPFVATNIDSTFPSKGMLLPGAGSVVEFVATAAGRTPTPCGKPSKGMMDAIRAEHAFDPKRAIMVGDRANTDMAFGRSGGLATLLVLTGIETEAVVEGLEGTPEEITYVASKLGDLWELTQGTA